MSAATIPAAGCLAASRVRAVDGVSFMLAADRPEIFAIIGESGSGKTTLARMILNIVPPSAGSIRFRGEALHHAWRRRRRLDFMRQVQPIFQNPFEAFNPLKRVDRYLFMTARRFASGRRRSSVPTTRCARSACRWPRCEDAIRTNCRAGSCSGSPSRVR